MNTLLDLKEIRCYSCTMLFAMPRDYYNIRLEDGRSFYCPLGHGQVFTKRADEIEELRKENQGLRSRTQWAETEADRAKNERKAARAALTRTKNRIANGVCPCCNRTFSNVARHMTTKHPDFKESQS